MIPMTKPLHKQFGYHRLLIVLFAIFLWATFPEKAPSPSSQDEIDWAKYIYMGYIGAFWGTVWVSLSDLLANAYRTVERALGKREDWPIFAIIADGIMIFIVYKTYVARFMPPPEEAEEKARLLLQVLGLG